ncbi:MAG: TonB-dependent receptor plug domain-containing protein [Candidatus Polarisedimenticolia bacterium]
MGTKTGSSTAGSRRGEWRRPFCALVLAAVASSPAVGQAGGEETLFLEVPRVISASRWEQGVNEAPASITVITAEEIRRFGHRTLADVLRNTRGFFTFYDRNYEYAGTRGFGRPGDYSNRILVMVDGHPHNEKWAGANYIGNDFGIDMDLVERIEIVRGPASAVYGSNALFAVVNVITRTPESMPGLQLRAGGGSFHSAGAGLSWGRSFGDQKSLLLGFSGQGSSGQDLFFPAYDDPATNFGVAEDSDAERYGNGFARARFGDWTFQAKGNVRRKEIPTGSYGTMFNDDGTYTTDARSFAEARHERLTAGGAEVSTRIYYDRLTYYGDYIFDIPPVVVNRDEGGAQWAGVESRWSRRVTNRHRVVVGANYEYNFKVYQRNYDEDPFFSRLDQEFSYVNYSGYVLDEIDLGSKVLLNLGLRHDTYETFGHSTNPRLALIYSPRRTTTLKFLYGSAFRAPTIYELYYDDAGYSIKENPDLRSEEIRTAEVVWEQALRRGMSLVGSVYRYEIDDLITQILDTGDGLLQFRNVDSVAAYGAEIEMSARTPAGIDLRFALTHERVEDEDSGAVLSNSPEQTALVSVAFPLMKNRAGLALQARYLSGRRTLTGDRTASEAVADLTFNTGSLWPWLDLQVGVRNLFDRDYADPGAGEHLQDQIPQDGRTWFFAVRHRF